MKPEHNQHQLKCLSGLPIFSLKMNLFSDDEDTKIYAFLDLNENVYEADDSRISIIDFIILLMSSS